MAFNTFIESPLIAERHQATAYAGAWNRTKGVSFNLFGPCKIPGGDLYTPIIGAHSIKLTLWKPISSSAYAVAVTKTFPLVGPGLFRLEFDDPYDVTWEVLTGGIELVHIAGTTFIMSVYETSGTYQLMSTRHNLNEHPPQCEMILNNCNAWLWGAGDSVPASGDWSATPLSPLVMVEDSQFLPATANGYCGVRNPNFQELAYTNPITVGYLLRVMQPIRIHGFQFATAVSGAHVVKLRFGVAQGYYNGKKVLERTHSCPGPGEYTELLSTPLDYDMPAIIDDLAEKVSPPYEYRMYKGHYVSMYNVTYPTKTSGVQHNPLLFTSGLDCSFHREIITDFPERVRWEDAEYLGMGDGGAYIRVPLSLLVERMGR
jgi:hypothetical protein